MFRGIRSPLYDDDPTGGGGQNTPSEGAEGSQGASEGGGGPALTPEQIAALKAQQEAQQEQLRQTQEMLRAMAAMYAQGQAPAARAEDDDDGSFDLDVDETDPKALLAQVQKVVEKTVQKHTSNIVQTVQQYARKNDERWVMTEKEKIAQRLKRAGMEDVLTEAERYLAENNISPEIAAAPGVFEKAVQLVVGQRVLSEKMAQGDRAPNLAAMGGAGSPAQTSPTAMKEEIEQLKALGIEMTEDEWKRYRDADGIVLDAIRARTQ